MKYVLYTTLHLQMLSGLTLHQQKHITPFFFFMKMFYLGRNRHVTGACGIMGALTHYFYASDRVAFGPIFVQ